MYKYLLFDADGTLLDFSKAEHHAFSVLCTAYGLSESLLPIFKQENKQVWKELESGTISMKNLKTERFSRFFTKLKITQDPKEAGELFNSALGTSAQVFEGVEILLTTLLKKEYTLYLITNGIAEVQHSRLEKSGLLPYFSGVFISEEIGAHKPQQAFFSTVEKLTNIETHETLIIGDGLSSDILGGNKYGIDTCWYNPNHEPELPGIIPTYTITTLHDLHSVLS